MSTRWYPIFQRNGPQLRVFLPNFWLKLVRTPEPQPKNVITFICSMEMTKYDIKNYLAKIYSLSVVDVRTRVALGEIKRDRIKNYITKDDDTKYAYVTLPKDQKFGFPNLFPEKNKEKKESEDRAIEDSKKGFKNFLDRNKSRPGTPSWFSI
ncbi:39S ribosomal protein L23, mitochondrial-like [Condylostylus longicornis]|uniref:39S ribosomal protein L23, mitochondrial-like n=1 Tax=Condylostylus longicornis TaxID=2530218 RepID=UPI00244DDEBF|nr:39S ribosomal protein L23, mitochondrial-like [Condylostylus longicornis]